MKRLFCLLLSFILVSPLMAANQHFTGEQKEEIHGMIRDYLVTNPQVLVEAGQALQRQEQARMMDRAKQAIKTHQAALLNAKADPVAGNPNGTVTLVEFFDYQCPHCKTATKTVDALIKANPNLRVVYKELPIFGASSDFAARAALAAGKQGKYAALHAALMKAPGRFNDQRVLDIAKRAGVNVSQLKKDMASPAYKEQIKHNYKLAQALGIVGTPAFIISDKNPKVTGKFFFVPGVATQSTLQSMIREVSKS